MKKVFVALANKEYIPYSKSLFYNVKDKWDGDFLLIIVAMVPNAGAKKGFQKRNIIRSYLFFASLYPVLNQLTGLIESINFLDG